MAALSAALHAGRFFLLAVAVLDGYLGGVGCGSCFGARLEFFARWYPKVGVERVEACFDAVLSVLQIVGVGVELHKGFVAKIFGLIYFALIHIAKEIVVVVVAWQVVVVVGKDILLSKVRANIVEFHPEHRITHGFAAPFRCTMQHGADGFDAALHASAHAVEFVALYDIVVEHFDARNVAVFYGVARIFFCAALGVGVYYTIAVEDVLHFHLVLVGKHFAAVEIFIGIDFAVDEQTHNDVEEALAVLIGLFGVEEASVGVLFDFEAAIDYAHPLEVGIALFCGFVERLHTVGDIAVFLGIGFLGVLASAAHHRCRTFVLLSKG